MDTDTGRVEQARSIYTELLTVPIKQMTDAEWQLFTTLEDLFHPKRGLISRTPALAGSKFSGR